MHFAANAYVGESFKRPLLYYHNITMNTLTLLQAMDAHNVRNFIYSSSCATYVSIALKEHAVIILKVFTYFFIIWQV